MNSPEKRWIVHPPISPQANQNLQSYAPVFRQVLFNRGYATETEAEAYLNGDPPQGDPFQMLGMEATVERIEHAIKNEQHITVYGDYDADGVTSSALLSQALEALKAKVSVYIPNRFTEGYGLNNTALDKLKSAGTDMIVTVDCGIRALEPAQHARKIGLDLVITDHHTPGAELPAAAALINPKQPGDPYPEKNLAGVGVAYKLAAALIQRLKPEGLNLEDLLDLVAIGTVADLVPLVGENRALVKGGLAVLRQPQRQGLFSLMGVAGLKPPSITAESIGFVLGPRINAAGRIGSAMDAYKLLTAKDVFEAGQFAQVLDNRNRERQRITAEIFEQVEDELFGESVPPKSGSGDLEGKFLLFAAHEDFNPGVVGLAASRLAERYYRPAAVGSRGESFTKASCRSIPEFHITRALEACADLLTRFGGHAAAAGFTVPNENLPELSERLQKLAEEALEGEELRPLIQADAEVPLAELTPSLLSDLAKMQPTGYGNPEAVFISRGALVRGARAVGRDGAHLKLTVGDGQVNLDAIAFRQGEWFGRLPERVDLIYTFELNEFNGRRSLQLNVKDIKEVE